MNPQAKILNAHGMLIALRNAILAVLAANTGATMSSNEILNALPPVITGRLNLISGGYSPRYPCGKAASYVGTVAAMEAKVTPSIFHNYHHYCPVLMKYEDAFVM